MTTYAQESLNGSLGVLTQYCSAGNGWAGYVLDPAGSGQQVWQGQVASGTGSALIQFNSDHLPMPPNPAFDRDFFLGFDFLIPDADTLANVQAPGQQVKVLLARRSGGGGGWDMDGFGYGFDGKNYRLESDAGQPGCLSLSAIKPIAPNVWYRQRNYYRFNSSAGLGSIAVWLNGVLRFAFCGPKFGWADLGQMRGSVGICYAQNVTGSGVRVCLRNVWAGDGIQP